MATLPTPPLPPQENHGANSKSYKHISLIISSRHIWAMSQLWNMVFAIVLNIVHPTYYNQSHYSGQIRYSNLQNEGRHVWVLKLAAPHCFGKPRLHHVSCHLVYKQETLSNCTNWFSISFLMYQTKFIINNKYIIVL